jgi:hypothetical protein
VLRRRRRVAGTRTLLGISPLCAASSFATSLNRRVTLRWDGAARRFLGKLARVNVCMVYGNIARNAGEDKRISLERALGVVMCVAGTTTRDTSGDAGIDRAICARRRSLGCYGRLGLEPFWLSPQAAPCTGVPISFGAVPFSKGCDGSIDLAGVLVLVVASVERHGYWW